MTESEMLDWLADNDVIEGFCGLEEDIHSIAYSIANPYQESVMGLDLIPEKEPTEIDYRLALRELIKITSCKK